jgi:hypothetical protein
MQTVKIKTGDHVEFDTMWGLLDSINIGIVSKIDYHDPYDPAETIVYINVSEDGNVLRIFRFLRTVRKLSNDEIFRLGQ